MQISDFLENLIKNKSDHKLTEEDKKIIKHEGIREFIFRKLNSSKYRAQATSEDYQQKIKDKIDLTINHEISLHLTLPFGATKNPYLPTAPGIDWGEIFNIAYLREYVAPIAAAYKYGLVLHYISVGVFEEQVNRIPQKDVDLYDRQFSLLCKYFRKYLPKNMKLEYSRVTDEIPAKEANRLIKLKKDELRKSWNHQSQEVRDYKLFRARRNCVFDPKDKNLDKILLESALGHDAFCSECWTTDAAPWDKKYMITLGHTYTTGWAIHVRSAPGSTINFWSGIGILEKRGERFIPTVLSASQYEAVKDKVKETRVSIFGSSLKPLKQIPVLLS